MTDRDERRIGLASKSQWQNHYTESIDHLHVMPVDDSMPHCPANSCYCKPSLELIARPDNSVGAVYLHKRMLDQ